MKLSPDRLCSNTPQPWLPDELQTSRREPQLPVETIQAVFYNTPAGSSSQPGMPGGEAFLSPSTWIPPRLEGVPERGDCGSWQPMVTTRLKPAVDPLQTIRNEAMELMDHARREAEAILAEARLQAKSIQSQAYEEGLKRAETEAQSALQAARSILEQVAIWRDEMLAQSESLVLGLVKQVSQKLFADGFVLDPQILQATFSRVLDNARSMGDLTIYIHPQDAVRLDPYWREFQVSVSGHRIQIIPSDAIRQGGCFVDGQWGTVDGRIETQLKAILGVLSPDTDDQGGQE